MHGDENSTCCSVGSYLKSQAGLADLRGLIDADLCDFHKTTFFAVFRINLQPGYAEPPATGRPSLLRSAVGISDFVVQSPTEKPSPELRRGSFFVAFRIFNS